MPEPFAVVSVAEMRALEGAAIEAGTPERVLQERAGLAVADVIENEVAELRAAGLLGQRERARVLALVGAGNNGRDAVVAGRRLAARGFEVGLWLGPRHALTDAELADLAAEGLGVEAFGDEPAKLEVLRAALAGADVIVDGLLGVGARGPMRPGLAAVATVVNAAHRERPSQRVVAVDVPSGIGADDGTVPGAAIQADVTVTFGAVKAGLLRFPAAGFAGRIVPRSIGLPAGSTNVLPVKVLDEATVAPLVPARASDAHKYRVGRVLAVAGSDQFVGAACLCVGAAARSGCGLVGLVSSEAVKRVLATRLPEATYPLTVDVVHERPEEAADQVAALLPEQQVLLIGPGIGRADATDRFLRRLLAANGSAERPVPAVIDADALTLLAGWDGWHERIGPNNVLTPHAGEMARLLGDDALPHEAPWDAARRASSRWKQIVVLKGPFTTVAEPSGQAWVYPRANPALATAGTGDVLAGLTAGLLAQGATPLDAARLAVVAHGLAGRRVVVERGWRSLLASDLLDLLPAVLACLERSVRPRM